MTQVAWFFHMFCWFLNFMKPYVCVRLSGSTIVLQVDTFFSTKGAATFENTHTHICIYIYIYMAANFLFVIKKWLMCDRHRKSSSPSLWAPGGARYGQGTSMAGPVRGPSVPIESRFGR